MILKLVAYKYRLSLWAVAFVWRIPARGTTILIGAELPPYPGINFQVSSRANGVIEYMEKVSINVNISEFYG